MATVITPSAEAATIQDPITYDHARLGSAPTQPILEDHVTIPPPPPTSSSNPLVSTRNMAYKPPPNPFRETATCTLHAFPSFEPVAHATYPSTHLLLPLRKDILHRAVIFEGDNTRLGRASTKWRSEVHGSNRKVRPQKGTGHARLGNKKSPMLRGGGVAFGPKPRDFGTKLQNKVYDLAVRTALSYRYKKGELILVEGEMYLGDVHDNSLERYMCDLLRWNGWGQFARSGTRGKGEEEEGEEGGGTNNGQTLFLTSRRRELLFTALESPEMQRHAKVKDLEGVDVKNLLQGARLVIERRALEFLLRNCQSDLPFADRMSGRKIVSDGEEFLEHEAEMEEEMEEEDERNERLL